MNRTWGIILLAIWLICMGAVMALSLHFDFQGAIMGVMAIVAGAFLLAGK